MDILLGFVWAAFILILLSFFLRRIDKD